MITHDETKYRGLTNISRFKFSGFFVGEWFQILYKGNIYYITKTSGTRNWIIEHKDKIIKLEKCRRKDISKTIKDIHEELYVLPF